MSPMSSQQTVNAMTVDVEEYFHVTGFADVVSPNDWSGFESRVEANTQRLLEILARYNMSATFFILGWVAERHPNLVRAIQRAGHEVACHGYGHALVYQSTPEEFRKDVRRAKGFLEDITGTRVWGYRAPSFSVTKSSLWAFDILAEEGFRYDSSIFPIQRHRCGIPDANRFPHQCLTTNGHKLIQFPISTLRVLGVNLPIGGGGYFRLLPFTVTRLAIQHLNNIERRPAIIYIHPWELDPAQPRISGRLVRRFRHYVNLHTTERKLDRLLDNFAFMNLHWFLQQLDGKTRLDQAIAESRVPSVQS